MPPIIPSAGTPTYNPANEIVKPVQTGLVNGTTPIFYYYNDTYAGTTTPLAQPVNINQIKFVKINLVLLKQGEDVTGPTFTVDSGTAVRNLKTNLGN
jgi:hypothetical protein